MTVDEAIYCMKSYSPDWEKDHCLKCKYNGSKKFKLKGVYICASAEAHRMAIEALEYMKKAQNTMIWWQGEYISVNEFVKREKIDKIGG